MRHALVAPATCLLVAISNLQMAIKPYAQNLSSKTLYMHICIRGSSI
mgnify:CR=1 FL=1